MRLHPRLLLTALAVPVVIAACDELNLDGTREVPTYEVVGGPLDQASASALLAALNADLGNFKIDEYLSEEGALFFVDAERFQALPVNQGTTGVASPEGDGEYTEYYLDVPAVQQLAVPPDPDKSVDVVDEALRTAKLHPDQLFRLGTDAESSVTTGHSRFELLGADMSPLADVDLDTHVDLHLALAAGTGFVDLVGQGSSLKVVLDASGAVMVHYEQLQLEPGPMITVIGEKAAASACADRYAKVTTTSAGLAPQQTGNVDVTAKLVYYAPPLETKTDTVYPYYRCDGSVVQAGGEALALRTVFVKANQSTPDIIEPPTDQPPVRPTAARAERGLERGLQPSAFGVHDAGTEWVGESASLSGSLRNAGRFYDTFDSTGGVDARFDWGDANAWERDFKDPTISGGNDTDWIDFVDVGFYTGHANGNGFVFTSSVDDGFLDYTDARWGQTDLEWLVIAACGPLQSTASGLSWAQRWGPAFRGLHLLLAYANVSRDNEVEGRIFARAILGVGESPKAIRAAWVKAATSVQPSSVTYAVMGVGNGNGLVNWNDHFWGRGGGGGPDISHGDITYYWKLSGPS